MNWRQIIRIVGPIVAGLALLAYQFAPSFGGASQFQERYSAWIASPEDPVAWDNLRKEFSSIPEGVAAPLAQQLLFHAKVEDAERLARTPLRQLRQRALPYAVYAQTSLLIAEKRYQDALEQSVRLNEAMTNEETLLCAYNKLRIASLQSALGNRAGEYAAWKEFQLFLKDHPLLEEQLYSSIRENGVSLKEYVDAHLKG